MNIPTLFLNSYKMLLVIIIAISLNSSINAMGQQNLSIQNCDYASSANGPICCSERTNIRCTKLFLWLAFLLGNASLFSGLVDMHNTEVKSGLLKAGVGTCIVLLDSSALWLMNSIKKE